MATLTYSEWKESRNSPKQGKTDFKVGYFNSLKDDGDEAIVRFAYDSTNDFDIQTVHVVEIDGKFKRVACLRKSVKDKTDCPLCGSGDYAKDKVFVKLLDYVKDENGKVTAEAKVWERPAKFIQRIVSGLTQATEMGVYPMTSKISDVVFKVKRVGGKGSTDTYYDVIPANPNVYKSDIYVKDFSDFDGLDLSHHSYSNKTAEEMTEYLNTGAFPLPPKTDKQPVAETPASHESVAPAAESRIQTKPNSSRYKF